MTGEGEGTWRQIKSLCLFRKGIVPAWEDKANQNGSEFRVTLDGENALKLDDYWKNLVFKLVGEEFINSEVVNFSKRFSSN